MTKNIPLSLACGDYESIRALKEGSVTVDGVELTVLTDMDSASPIAGELACMYGLGVVRGRTGTTFDPETGVTRAEAAAFISRFYQAVSSPRWSAS